MVVVVVPDGGRQGVVDKFKHQGFKELLPQSTLHILSLLGGWPGALLAQQTLRHKTQKKDYRFMFWVTVVLNCGGLYWLLTPDGAGWLNDLISSF